MKKIFWALFLFFIANMHVYAYDFDYKKEEGKYFLLIVDDEKAITYEEAMDKYELDDYMIYTIDDKDYYFYKGKEISYKEYEEALEEREIKTMCDSMKESCKIVSSTDEIKQKIDEIYATDESGIFYLLYTTSNYNKIDFDEVNEYFSKHYVSDINKNIYKYNDYALRKPNKFLLNYDNQRIILDMRTRRTTSEEITKVNKFLDSFLKLFSNKSDYEKVLGAYTYINNTAKYEKDNGYTNSLDGQLSAYDVLIKHKTVCIGAATTFQLLMERLGIESYIVDHVQSKSDTEYSTTHTYNIVKLDGEWYIVDIAFDDKLSGLLKGMSEDYSLDDFKYYDIKIADSSYFDTHSNVTKKFDFDYSTLLDLTLEIDKSKEKKEEIIQESKNYIKEYILIGIILVVILIIIWFFTRKR